ncbi:MAG: hypothetical protein JEZ10_02585 [Verrucomicrobia bacterium]|nr:hypothetical protein [Verrucomicrobiota bacterium]
MIFLKKPNRNLWLWWVSIVSLSIGISIFILLKPADQDYEIQRYRSMALVFSMMISGLCIIIGTQRRWFGKDL